MKESVSYRGFILQNDSDNEWVAWLPSMPEKEEHWFRAPSLTELKKQIDKTL